MIKRFKVKNYKTIKEEMILDFKETSNFLGLWGRNDTGKTNLVDAFLTAVQIFHEGMRYMPKDLYYAFDVDDRSKATQFEFEFGFEGRMYRYGWLVSFFKGEILSEYLYKKSAKKEIKLYEKKQSNIEIGDVFDIGLSKEEKERLKIYLYDLKFDKKTLFASHMKEKNFYHTSLTFFNDIYYFFNRIYVYKPQELIHFFETLDENNHQSMMRFIGNFEPDIERIGYESVSLDDLRISLGRHRYDHLIDTWRGKTLETEDTIFTIRAYDKFYRFKGRNFDQLSIFTFEVKYQYSLKPIAFDLLSTGLKHLIHLAMILTSPTKNAFYIIDQLTYHLNPKLNQNLIDIMRDMLKENKSMLLFTTQDALLLNQNYFSRDEIWFMYRKEGKSLVKPLTDYKVRLDKVLDKAYLNDEFDLYR